MVASLAHREHFIKTPVDWNDYSVLLCFSNVKCWWVVHVLLLASRHNSFISALMSGLNSTREQSIFFISVMLGYIQKHKAKRHITPKMIAAVIASSFIKFNAESIIS